MVALHTARICEFFVKCLCSGLWSGSFSVFFSVVWSSSPTASLKFIRLLPVVFSSQQRAFSWILFFQFFKACVSSCSFRTQTSVAIFPSRFKWWEHKHARDVWSSLLGFKFNAVSGILELQYSLLYRAVFR